MNRVCTSSTSLLRYLFHEHMKDTEELKALVDDPPPSTLNTLLCDGSGTPGRSEPRRVHTKRHRLFLGLGHLGAVVGWFKPRRPSRRAARDKVLEDWALIGSGRKQVSTETSEIRPRLSRQVQTPAEGEVKMGGKKNVFNDLTDPVPESCFGSTSSDAGKQGRREDGFQMGPIEELEDVEELVRSLQHDLIKLNMSESRKARFAAAVELLHDARHAKEAALLQKPRDERLLDITDQVEREACCILYGLFKYALGEGDGTPEYFDKNKCDEVMEKEFGSLDRDDSILGEGDEHDARILFSIYLTRKIWSPLPWRKFDDALRGFLNRTVHNPIQAPVDQDALNVARTILDILIRLGPSPAEFREVEVNSDSACLERSKVDGGKRVALYEEGDQMLGFKYVVPKPIYTGGKVRVITISSAESARYNWVNKWLGACFRRLDCSVFGGDVADWWARQKGAFVPNEGEKYISGDLEAATDNFDSRITAELIKDMCGYLGLEYEDEWKMRRFTTDATFRVGSDFYRQSRGNMMGSEISFPFLCIFSLTAYICKNPEIRTELYRRYNKNPRKPRAAFRFLSSLRLGVNGDDVVFIAKNGLLWEAGVAAIGGVVSKGKSLANPYYFTINSELWCRQGPLPSARPTFVTALNDGRKYFIHPAREYLEYLRFPFWHDSSIFDIERRLNLDIPVRWGGLGLCKRFDPYRAALYKLKSEYERAQARKAKLHGSRAALEEDEERKKERGIYGPKVTVRMSRTMRDAYTARFFSTKASWREKSKLEYPVTIPTTARFMAAGAGRELVYEEWKKLMVPRDFVVYDLPVELVQVFQAVPLDQNDYIYKKKKDFGPLEFDSGIRTEISQVRERATCGPPTNPDGTWRRQIPRQRTTRRQNQWNLELRRLDFVGFYANDDFWPEKAQP